MKAADEKSNADELVPVLMLLLLGWFNSSFLFCFS